MGKIIFRFQQIEELYTGITNRKWIKRLRNIVETINKYYEITPKVIDAIHNQPRADGDSRYMFIVGTKVRRQLDNPIGITNEKLHGRFRATDIRWNQKISTITRVFILPDSPPLYQLDNNDQTAYTKNQLQKVEASEKMPERFKKN